MVPSGYSRNRGGGCALPRCFVKKAASSSCSSRPRAQGASAPVGAAGPRKFSNAVGPWCHTRSRASYFDDLYFRIDGLFFQYSQLTDSKTDSASQNKVQ
jgi:hypothetical protein